MSVVDVTTVSDARDVSAVSGMNDMRPVKHVAHPRHMRDVRNGALVYVLCAIYPLLYMRTRSSLARIRNSQPRVFLSLVDRCAESGYTECAEAAAPKARHDQHI